MKIALVLGPSTGGIGVHVSALQHHYEAMGHRAKIITSDTTAEHFSLGGAVRAWPAGPAATARAFRVARAVAAEAEVVHAHGFQAALWASLWCGGTPLVVSLHNEPPTSAAASLILRLARRRLVKKTCAASGASRDLTDWLTRAGIAGARFVPVSSQRAQSLAHTPRLDLPQRRERARALMKGIGRDPSLPLVLGVARVAPQKRLEIFLEVAQRLRGQANFVVVGAQPGPLRQQLEDLDRVGDLTLLGAREDLDAWYWAASALLVTSGWEARALVVQEALASGLPCVVTRAGGLPELVKHGQLRAGITVDAGDTPGYAQAVETLLRGGDTWHNMSVAGREIALTWPTEEENARGWIENYRRCG